MTPAFPVPEGITIPTCTVHLTILVRASGQFPQSIVMISHGIYHFAIDFALTQKIS